MDNRFLFAVGILSPTFFLLIFFYSNGNNYSDLIYHDLCWDSCNLFTSTIYLGIVGSRHQDSFFVVNYSILDTILVLSG